MIQRTVSLVLLVSVVVVNAASTAAPNKSDGHAALIRRSRFPLTSLVSGSARSVNDQKFDWPPQLDDTVSSLTSLWDFAPEQLKHKVLNITRDGFVSYCIRFQTMLGNWAMKIKNRPDVSELMKEKIAEWYTAVSNLPRKDWNIPENIDLESFKDLFGTAYEHLIVNGKHIYDLASNSELRDEVHSFVKKVALTMTDILSHISHEIDEIYRG